MRLTQDICDQNIKASVAMALLPCPPRWHLLPPRGLQDRSPSQVRLTACYPSSQPPPHEGTRWADSAAPALGSGGASAASPAPGSHSLASPTLCPQDQDGLCTQRVPGGAGGVGGRPDGSEEILAGARS